MLGKCLRVSRFRSRKFCSHLATSELKSILARVREGKGGHGGEHVGGGVNRAHAHEGTAMSLGRRTIGTVVGRALAGVSVPESSHCGGVRAIATISSLYGAAGGCKISTVTNGGSASAVEKDPVETISSASGCRMEDAEVARQRHKLKPITIPGLHAMHRKSKPITQVTAYDYTSAQICDRAGADIILVGDSVGMVVLGYDSTVPVTLDDMLHHTKAVTRAASRPLVVGDMAFGSYLTPEDAARSACRLVKEGGCDAVKLEGGKNVGDCVRAIVGNGMAVQGHIGLLPQHVASSGGYRLQGKTPADATRLLRDALALQEAGCFSIVLEMVPDRVAEVITEALDIPTIGIGAGPHCSGQVQVFHDLLGLYDKMQPKFSKRFAELAAPMQNGIESYVDAVRTHKFPGGGRHCTMSDDTDSSRHSFPIQDRHYDAWRKDLRGKMPSIAKRVDRQLLQIEQEAGPGQGSRLKGSQLDTNQLSQKASLSKSEASSDGSTLKRDNSSGAANLVVVDTVPALRKARAEMHALSLSEGVAPTIGFVPTMGFLHEGHLELVREARKENEFVVVSVYVNPTQFAAHEDLDTYPRDLERDVSLLRAEGVDLVFAPRPGTSLFSSAHRTWVVPDSDGALDEGTSRPGFFRGVATVVTKLLNMVQPTRAYFGQKDAQQAAVVRDLVSDLGIGCSWATMSHVHTCDFDAAKPGLEIVILPTVRECDGLAKSSRNEYLSNVERKAAPALYKALNSGKSFALSKDRVKVADIRKVVSRSLAQEPLFHTVDYVTVADIRTMEPLVDDDFVALGQNARVDGAHVIAAAAKIGSTRLIDNVVLGGV